MILTEQNKNLVSAIIQYCKSNGMDELSLMGLHNELVKLFKKIEIFSSDSALLKELLKHFSSGEYYSDKTDLYFKYIEETGLKDVGTKPEVVEDLKKRRLELGADK